MCVSIHNQCLWFGEYIVRDFNGESLLPSTTPFDNFLERITLAMVLNESVSNEAYILIIAFWLTNKENKVIEGSLARIKNNDL